MIKNLRFREVLIGLVLIAFLNMTLWVGLRKPSLSKRYIPDNIATRRQGQNITEPQQTNHSKYNSSQEPNVLIVILVLTSVIRYDRRQMIRNTWWTKCKDPTTVR
jgi:hypothetical protein